MSSSHAAQPSATRADLVPAGAAPAASPWRELFLKEDWWAIWLGLGIVLTAYLFFVSGSSIRCVSRTCAST